MWDGIPLKLKTSEPFPRAKIRVKLHTLQCFTSHATAHALYVTRYTSRVMIHLTTHLTRDSSLLSSALLTSLTVTPHACYLTRFTSRVTPHALHLTRYTSRVTHHALHITRDSALLSSATHPWPATGPHAGPHGNGRTSGPKRADERTSTGGLHMDNVDPPAAGSRRYEATFRAGPASDSYQPCEYRRQTGDRQKTDRRQTQLLFSIRAKLPNYFVWSILKQQFLFYYFSKRILRHSLDHDVMFSGEPSVGRCSELSVLPLLVR